MGALRSRLAAAIPASASLTSGDMGRNCNAPVLAMWCLDTIVTRCLPQSAALPRLSPGAPRPICTCATLQSDRYLCPSQWPLVRNRKNRHEPDGLSRSDRPPPRPSGTRRIQMLGGVVRPRSVVIVVAIVVSSGGGGNSSGLQKGHNATKTYAQVNQLLHGIPQQGTPLATPSAGDDDLLRRSPVPDLPRLHPQ